MRTQMSPGIWRYPHAVLTPDDEAVIFAGDAEMVLPAGVIAGNGWQTPIKVKSSIGDAFDSFRLMAQTPEERQAGRLLRHVQKHGLDSLCTHGLPIWHVDPPRRTRGSCGSADVGGVGNLTGIWVRDAVRMARYFDSVLDASLRAKQGKPLSKAILEDVLALPWMQTGLPAGGPVTSSSQKRQLVEQAANGFLVNAHTNARVGWPPQHSTPELVMSAEDSWGAYVLEMVRRLGTSDELPSTHECSICGSGVQLARRPRDGVKVYCQTPSCQRERKRRNLRSYRNRKAGENQND